MFPLTLGTYENKEWHKQSMYHTKYNRYIHYEQHSMKGIDTTCGNLKKVTTPESDSGYIKLIARISMFCVFQKKVNILEPGAYWFNYKFIYLYRVTNY